LSSDDSHASIEILSFCILVQAISVAAAALLPFGFDKRSWIGLDFEHLLVLLGIYFVAVAIGLIYAAAYGKWNWLGAQVAGLLGTCAVLLLLSRGFQPDRNPKGLDLLPPTHTEADKADRRR
jgi:hypothetical protein